MFLLQYSTVFGVVRSAGGGKTQWRWFMVPDKKREKMGGIYVLPRKDRDVKSRVGKARRGGLLGADRAGTYWKLPQLEGSRVQDTQDWCHETVVRTAEGSARRMVQLSSALYRWKRTQVDITPLASWIESLDLGTMWEVWRSPIDPDNWKYNSMASDGEIRWSVDHKQRLSETWK